MRRALAAAALVLALTTNARADDLVARALLGYERYDLGTRTANGYRQTYDLRLSKALTTTSIVRLFFRGDDFQGTSVKLNSPRDHSRQIQPGGELVVNALTFHAQARTEYFDVQSRYGGIDTARRLTRTSGQLLWSPASLPVFMVTGQRNNTRDSASSLRLTDESLYGTSTYEWRGLHASAGQRYARSTDPQAGYDRRTLTREASLGYTTTAFNNKLSVTADANAQRMKIDERAVGGRQSSVPTPVTITRALFGIDDTPSDDRDHPLSPYPALIDNHIDAGAGPSLSPDSVSFQNFALDLGRSERLDEIRVIVRNSQGNPLRNGGGPVQWDLYTSEDGILWTLQSATTSFNAPLSLYSVTFQQVIGRWFKVVSFGVNAEETLVTELQAYYHTEIGASAQRSGIQNFYNGLATVTYRPVLPLLVSYTGVYTAARQELTSLPLDRSTNLEHIASVQYDARTWLSLRSQVYRRKVNALNTPGGNANGRAYYADFKPTKQLLVTLESNREEQTIGSQVASIETKAVHTSAYIVRSFAVNLDGGVQDEVLAGSGAKARRTFVTFVGHAQLLPTLRMLLTASMQKNRTDSSDPALQLLGAARDNRYFADFIWRPGPQLTTSTRFGWLSSDALSGFTQRYHVEWRPFSDGTLALAAAFDEDIDPVTDRRARRTIINPRWLVNRWATVDVNYTAVSTVFTNGSLRQRTLFATLTLTK